MLLPSTATINTLLLKSSLIIKRTFPLKLAHNATKSDKRRRAEGFLASKYVVTITKAQIEALIKSNLVQLSMFDTDVAEVITNDATRYILRRNDVRAQEIKRNRVEKLKHVTWKLAERNAYLSQHLKARLGKALARIQKLLKKLRLSWVSVCSSERCLVLIRDEKLLAEIEKFDCCYASSCA